ncbi:MAG: hypothetical protein V3V61_07720 [Gammaproteobacteria bacterium]
MKNNKIFEFISHDRLKSYQILCPSNEEKEIIGAYHWNLLICQNFYPFIQSIEVTLRNAIHNAVSCKFDTSDWFDVVVREGVSKKMLDQVRKDLKEKGKKNIRTSDIVASLNFGFWVGLIRLRKFADLSNTSRLWPELIPKVFPYYKREDKERQNIAKRFYEAKLIRNRLFHHEPIWKFKEAHTPDECITELRHKFNDIFKAIGWLSKDVKNNLRNYGFVENFRKACSIETLNAYKTCASKQ